MNHAVPPPDGDDFWIDAGEAVAMFAIGFVGVYLSLHLLRALLHTLGIFWWYF